MNAEILCMKLLYRKCVVGLACLTLFVGLFYSPIRQSHKNHLLTAAMEKGDVASALAALAVGADPNAHFIYENRPRDVMGVIHWALRDQAIVWHDAPVLSEACEMDQVPLVRAFLERGANVNAKDKIGYTALLQCIEMDKPEITVLLLEYGADPNIRDPDGNTALMRLAKNQFSTVQSLPLLLQNGAKPSLKNKEGKTALQLAREANHLVAVRLLEQVGIKE